MRPLGRNVIKVILVAVLFALADSGAHAKVFHADVCLYEGTSGGVVAAVEVARDHKTAVILECGLRETENPPGKRRAGAKLERR